MLSAEVDTCNDGQNGLDVYAAIPDTDALRVVGADHCDFEDPTDWACTAFCSDGSGNDVSVRDAIRGLSTAWVLWRSGVAPAAEEWWTPGTVWYDELADAGTIARP